MSDIERVIRAVSVSYSPEGEAQHIQVTFTARTTVAGELFEKGDRVTFSGDELGEVANILKTAQALMKKRFS